MRVLVYMYVYTKQVYTHINLNESTQINVCIHIKSIITHIFV